MSSVNTNERPLWYIIETAQSPAFHFSLEQLQLLQHRELYDSVVAGMLTLAQVIALEYTRHYVLWKSPVLIAHEILE